MLHILVFCSSDFVNMVHRKDTGAELAGSWTVEIGDQDEASENKLLNLFYQFITDFN